MDSSFKSFHPRRLIYLFSLWKEGGKKKKAKKSDHAGSHIILALKKSTSTWVDGEIRGGGSPSPSQRHQSIPPQLQPSAALQLFTWITPVRVGAYRWFTTVVCPNILSCTPLTRLTFKSRPCTGPKCAGRFTLTHDTQVSAALCSIIHYVSLPSLHVDISTCIKAQIYTGFYLWKPLYQASTRVSTLCASTFLWPKCDRSSNVLCRRGWSFTKTIL